MKSQKELALEFLGGLRMDIIDSEHGFINIEKTDIEQVNNCIQLIEESEESK